MKYRALIPVERIERTILIFRGHKIILDSALADLYDVSTKQLVQAVKRNVDRFPKDFMFQLDAQEVALLRSQTVTSKKSRGGRRYAPFAFTEQGIAMLSSVLHSQRAIRINIEIMRAFVRLRELVTSHEELAHKLEELENKYDVQFKIVIEAIRDLMIPQLEEEEKREIGFHIKETAPPYRVGKRTAKSA
jgi:hypothetical protein